MGMLFLYDVAVARHGSRLFDAGAVGRSDNVVACEML